MKRIFAGLVAALFLSGTAYACSCIWEDDATVKSHAASVDAIFQGEYLGERGRTSDAFGILVTGQFHVIEALKGDVPSVVDLGFFEDNGANCGLIFERGVAYEVFAHDVGGLLQTSDCDGTRKAGTGSKRWSWRRYRSVLRK